jgi:threonine dehydrogenase-like Zn-dependent dehydrogenase
MRGLTFDGTLRYSDDLPRPVPAPGEALVRVLMAGICNTDLEIVRGYMGFRGTPGHEFVGRVEKAPDPAWIGRRVAGEINAACGTCATCRAGRPRHCPHRTVLGILNRSGAFADYLTLPVENLHALPDSVPDERAIFVEPLAAAFEIPEQDLLRPEDRVLVLGDGKLGLLVAQVLDQALDPGGSLTLLGRHPERADLARHLGFDFALAEGYGGPPADLVVDCTGSAAGFRDAVRLTRPRGTLVLKSTVADAVPLNLAPLVIDEITVAGSRCGPFPPAIQALAEGRIQVDPLLVETFPLEEGLHAFDRAAAPGALKIALQCEAGD